MQMLIFFLLYAAASLYTYFCLRAATLQLCAETWPNLYSVSISKAIKAAEEAKYISRRKIISFIVFWWILWPLSPLILTMGLKKDPRKRAWSVLLQTKFNKFYYFFKARKIFALKNHSNWLEPISSHDFWMILQYGDIKQVFYGDLIEIGLDSKFLISLKDIQKLLPNKLRLGMHSYLNKRIKEAPYISCTDGHETYFFVDHLYVAKFSRDLTVIEWWVNSCLSGQPNPIKHDE